MRIPAAAYASQLKALLPSGAAWNLEASSRLSHLLLGTADELARVDGRAGDLWDESDPRLTSELLTDWERVYGLPSGCVTDPQSTAERRFALVAAVVGIGRASPAYFITLAAALGYAITLTEYRPHTCDSDCDTALMGDDWAHAWQVNAPANTVTEFDALSNADDPLAAWGNTMLRCVFTTLKPAQTVLLFNFS